MRTLLPRALLAALFLALLGCTAVAPTPNPTPTPDPCQAVDNVEPDDDTCGDQSMRHPPGGLPQVLPTPIESAPAAAPLRVETVVDGVNMPLSMVWTPDGRKMFFSEVKLGQIRVVIDGVLQPEPFARLPIAKGAETGMLGLAVDPDYERNHYIYAYHSDPESNRNRVLRFVDLGTRASEPTEILKTVAISDHGGAHNAGRMVFGPDRKLYVTVGNGQNTNLGQNPCKLGGKILRINPDGSRPSDDPFDCSPVYAYGFRNPFGIAFHPVTGQLFVTENGGRGHDEFNLVRPGQNYGHPVVEGIANDPRFVDPLWESGPISIGPVGLTFYTGDRLPEFKNDAFFCGVHTGQLSQVRLAPPNYDRVEAMRVEVLRDQVDCRLDVTTGPDGALYFSNFTQIGRITR